MLLILIDLFINITVQPGVSALCCHQNPLVLRKTETRMKYRLEIRKEESKRKHEEKCPDL